MIQIQNMAALFPRLHFLDPPALMQDLLNYLKVKSCYFDREENTNTSVDRQGSRFEKAKL
jgi:hypothetical protein